MITARVFRVVDLQEQSLSALLGRVETLRSSFTHLNQELVGVLDRRDAILGEYEQLMRELLRRSGQPVAAVSPPILTDYRLGHDWKQH